MSIRGINIPLDMGATIVPLKGKTGNNTAQEDNPSAPSPAIIYEMRNVMPSELGYSSAFAGTSVRLYGESTWEPHNPYCPGYIYKFRYFADPTPVMELANLIKDSRVQKVLPVQAGTGDTVYLILTEEGIYGLNPTSGDSTQYPHLDGSDTDFAKYKRLVSMPAEDPQFFNLWTSAYVNNRLFLYRQGYPKVLVVGDGTLYSDMENWDVEIKTEFASEDFSLMVVSAVPTFLNMEGQIGIFQAGNRLGFWDSDNALSWGSSFNPVDFKPDVISLAGITKFSEVVGDIIQVVPTIGGFNIYATSSIVNVRQIAGSQEVFGAKALIKNDGINYYFQVASAGNPNTHFAWTRTGLYVVTPDSAQAILQEEYRELTSKRTPDGDNYLYSLFASGDQYLIISQASRYQERPVRVDIQGGVLEGSDKDYPYYLPTIPPYVPEGELWKVAIEGGAYRPDINPKDFVVEEDVPWPPLEEVRPLIPCYSGYGYTSPDKLALLEATIENDSKFPVSSFRSYHWPHITFTRQDSILQSLGEFGCREVPNRGDEHIGVPSLSPAFTKGVDWAARPPIGYPNNAFFDMAGPDFIDLVQSAFTEFARDRDYIATIIGEKTPDLWDRRITCDDSVYLEEPISLGKNTGWEVSGIMFSDGLNDPPYEEISIPATGVSAFNEALSFARIVATLELELESINTRLLRLDEDSLLYAQLSERRATIVDVDLPHNEALYDEKMDEANELLSWVFGDSPPPYDNMVVSREEEAISWMPVPGLEPIVRQDDCSIAIYAYVDDLVGVSAVLPQVVPLMPCIREFSPKDSSYVERVENPPEKDRFGISCSVGDLTPVRGVNLSFCADSYCGEGNSYPQGLVAWYFNNTHLSKDCAGGDWCPVELSDGCYAVAANAYILGPSVGLDQRTYYMPKSFIGKTAKEVLDLISTVDTNNQCWVPIFQAEVSGYGYFPKGGFSFRKTLSKARLWMQSPEGKCTPKDKPREWHYSPDESGQDYNWESWYDYDTSPNVSTAPRDDPQEGLDYPASGNLAEVGWEWPFDVTYSARFRKGTKAPYYPIYEKAWVRDLALNKWGSLDIPHSSVFTAVPSNSLGASISTAYLEGVYPFGIVPKFATPETPSTNNWARLYNSSYNRVDPKLLSQHQLPTFLSYSGGWGELMVGDIALTREGITKLTGLYLEGARRSDNTSYDGLYDSEYLQVSVMGSVQGASYSYAGSNNPWTHNAYFQGYVGKEGSVRVPFVLTGKEFRIAVQGSFRLHKLICYGEPTGRLMFPSHLSDID